ncbi:hypothetical protein QBD01_003699 [Ochrobactrum sp. 19YEA23]|uniref:hypothetical protein n=1 Tax=Ochrobactrum sp. 19YEA23 TaxID=3039854 RepID=UPI00247A4497|nr:hypothetical protein [Ochrobactrum sp. 19YEA23]
MADIQTGGPAFPEITGFHQRQHAKEKQRLGYDAQCEGGMTLRDYIAAKALQGFLASEFVSDFNKEIGPYRTDADIRRNLATNAYLYADAMLAARGEAV